MTEISNFEDLKSTLVGALVDLGLQLAGVVPKLLGMLAILLIGWVIARAVQAVTAKVLVSMKLDQAAGYLGLSEILANAGIKRPTSALISRLLFWLLILAFILPATETLGLTSVTTTINRLIAFLPNVIAATPHSLAGATTCPISRERGRFGCGIFRRALLETVGPGGPQCDDRHG